MCVCIQNRADEIISFSMRKVPERIWDRYESFPAGREKPLGGTGGGASRCSDFAYIHTRRTLRTERAPLAGTRPLLRAALINRITNVEKKT